MDLYTIGFYLFAIITLVSALIVVSSKNILYSGFSLLFTFFGVAGLYVLLTADFVAITQLMIYVGAILVLILFGVMLTTKVISVDLRSGMFQTLPAVLVVAALTGTLVGVFCTTDWKVSPNTAGFDKTAPRIGEMLLGNYLLPFEIASVLLLVALVGAAMIARREKKIP